MFSTILIIVLLLIIWFLVGFAYMFLSMYSTGKPDLLGKFLIFPVDCVFAVTKRFKKR